jgi:hypothetical protein
LQQPENNISDEKITNFILGNLKSFIGSLALSENRIDETLKEAAKEF